LADCEGTFAVRWPQTNFDSAAIHLSFDSRLAGISMKHRVRFDRLRQDKARPLLLSRAPLKGRDSLPVLADTLENGAGGPLNQCQALGKDVRITVV
jgi:hypothetical protein